MNPDRPSSALVDRLLAVSLTVKLLTANGVLVLLWTAATWVAWHYGDEITTVVGYPLVVVAVALGSAISVAANALVLRSALRPVRELARVAAAVDGGIRGARARPGRVRDPQTDRLIALTNRMLDTLESQRAEVEASAAVLGRLSKGEMQAREDERQSVSRELLEDVAQSCAAAGYGLQALVRLSEAETVDRVALRAQTTELQVLIRGVSEVVSRRAQGLRPSSLDQLGLVAALRSAGRRWSAELGVDVDVVADDVPRLPGPAETALYRVAEEAVANAVRGAHARRVDVSLRLGRQNVYVEVVDDGGGPDRPDEATDAGTDRARMRERIAAVGGRLTVTDGQEQGTVVLASVPVEPSRVTNTG